MRTTPRPETLCVEAGHHGAAGDPVTPAIYLSTTYHQGGDLRVHPRRLADDRGVRARGRLARGRPRGGVLLRDGRGRGGARRPRARLAGAGAGRQPTSGCGGCSPSAPSWARSRSRTSTRPTPRRDRGDRRRGRWSGPRRRTTRCSGSPTWRRSPAAAHERGAAARRRRDARHPAAPATRSSLGADFVVHSATKYLAGHADSLLGVVVTADEAGAQTLIERREHDRRGAGPVRDLSRPARDPDAGAAGRARVRRTPASWLRDLRGHPAVSRVRYPGLDDDPGHELAARQMSGFGAMIAFEVGAGAEAADAVCAGVRRIANATSLGGVETLIERRGRYAEEQEQVPGQPDPAVGRLRARRGSVGGSRAGARAQLTSSALQRSASASPVSGAN